MEIWVEPLIIAGELENQSAIDAIVNNLVSVQQRQYGDVPVRQMTYTFESKHANAINYFKV